VFEMLGGQGSWADMPRIDEVAEEGGRPYPVITGDYSGAAAWASAPIRPGTPLQAPTPLYAKIDPAVVVEELNRLGGYDTDAEDG
jgi:methionyl-tRNA synthetase